MESSRHEDQGHGSNVVPHPTQTPPPDPVPDSGDLDQAIAQLRARVDEELHIAERLDAKARQAVALAAGFFVLIQTVAFGSFAEARITDLERGVLVISAAIAGIMLLVLLHRLRESEELVETRDVRPESIIEWVEDGEPEGIRLNLIRHLAEMARDRAAASDARARKFDRVSNVARWAVIVAAGELMIALVVRL